MARKPYRHVVVWGIILCLNALQLTAAAGLVPVTLVSSDFDILLGGSATTIGSPLITNMTSGSLLGQIISQAFTDGQGNYAYLYQVKNIGASHVIEQFTCDPFADASGTTILGYLTANAPDGFTLGQQAPMGASVNPDAGPTVSFVFPGYLLGQIDPGKSSHTLYVLSDKAPSLIDGNIINGAVASGLIVGPLPEPATLGIISAGAVMLYLLRGKMK